MRILHTEASPGWGGQEMRILRESLGMRERGHEVIFAVQKGGGLGDKAREKGFIVFEFSFAKRSALSLFFSLCSLIIKYKIDIVNTHSSLDAWLGGIAARLLFRSIIRTRHLSTPVKGGLNAYLLYKTLADCVATTCEATASTLQKQARLSASRCFSVPTGIEPREIHADEKAITAFRQSVGVREEDLVVGTCCVLRGWKGISDLLHAAKLLEHLPHLKWVVIGSGVSEDHFKQERKQLGLEEKVAFVGHLSPPFTAIAALDLFLLLSWAHEGVSQAALQAALLKKPLITTPTGGLGEICLHDETGWLVPPHSPAKVAEAVEKLLENPPKRKEMGERAHSHVLERFTLTTMLDTMENLYHRLKNEKRKSNR